MKSVRMHAVRVLLGVLAIAVAAIVTRQFVIAPPLTTVRPDSVGIQVSAGLVVVFAGLAVWQLRPRLSSGPLLTCAGFAVLLSVMTGIDSTWLDLVGTLTWACFPLVIGTVLLSHPDGLPQGRRTAVITVCWVVPATLGLGLLMTAGSWRPARLTPYVRRPVHIGDIVVADRPHLAQAFAVIQSCWTGAAAVVIAVAVMVRARRSGRAARPGLLPIAWAGGVWAAGLLAAIPFSHRKVDGLPDRTYEVLMLVAVVMPAVTASLVAGAIVWAELVRPRLDPAREGRIVLTGEALPVAEVLRQRLATALGDPSLKLAIRSDDGDWLAPNGKRVDLRDDAERATTTLTRDGQVIAALEHDHALRLTPDVVVVATTMAGLAIENVRLSALDAAQAEETRSSGELLLAAADRARQRLMTTIADGPAAELSNLAQRAARADGADHRELGRALRQVAAEVRTISHGLFPPELQLGGLSAVLDHADVVPTRRYPPAVELTAYLVARGAVGARLRDDDGRLVIDVPGPVSDDAVARIDALDGTILTHGDGSTVTIPMTE